MKLFKDEDIAGYTFKAENLCKDCTIDAMNKAGLLDEREGEVLDLVEFAAKKAGVDQEDHYSFNSDDFPKSFLLEQVDDDETCDRCGLYIIPHVGHRSHFTGAWFCDTCNSPYCDRA